MCPYYCVLKTLEWVYLKVYINNTQPFNHANVYFTVEVKKAVTPTHGVFSKLTNIKNAFRDTIFAYDL